MPEYNYKARDKFGKSLSGIMQAESADAVASRLVQMGHAPILVKINEQEGILGKLSNRLNRVSFSDLNLFTRQFAVLQKSGITILQSLRTLGEQTENRLLKKTLENVSNDIQAGASFSEALSKHPAIFNTLYVNMVASGETGGILSQALARLAVLGEQEELTRMRLKQAVRYPFMVVIAILIGFLVLITTVVPRFARLYGQFNTELPLPTRIMIGLNTAITKYWFLTLVLLVAYVFILRRFIATKRGRMLWDTMKLKIPIFGELILKIIMARFTRVTATLMKSGVPILKVLDLAARGSGNALISQTIEQIMSSVNEGKGVAEPMKVSGLFPPVVIQMVAVGEETGKLDELLTDVADFYDSQIDYTISNFTSLIEPILIFVLGCAVLFMALGIFLPMWNMMSLFHR